MMIFFHTNMSTEERPKMSAISLDKIEYIHQHRSDKIAIAYVIDGKFIKDEIEVADAVQTMRNFYDACFNKAGAFCFT